MTEEQEQEAVAAMLVSNSKIEKLLAALIKYKALCEAFDEQNEALLICLQNVVREVVSYYPSAATNFPSIVAANELLSLYEDEEGDE